MNNKYGSYRDPSGYIFKEDSVLYRAIEVCYKEDYELMMNSGLYDELVRQKFLISHKEVSENFNDKGHYNVIEPIFVPFISYPYEWSFSQLKDAALLTLKIQKIALDHGMILKDATPFNVQFFEGRAIFIDTLSF